MEIIAIEGHAATVRVAAVTQKCDLSLVEGAAVGDYVIVHAGFAIEVLDEQDAKETLAMLDQLGLDTSPGDETLG